MGLKVSGKNVDVVNRTGLRHREIGRRPVGQRGLLPEVETLFSETELLDFARKGDKFSLALSNPRKMMNT